MSIDPAHRLPAGPGEQAHGAAGERALAARVAALEQALAVERERREGAERLAAERAARIEDLRVSLRMLEAAPPDRRRRAAPVAPVVAVGRAGGLAGARICADRPAPAR